MNHQMNSPADQTNEVATRANAELGANASPTSNKKKPAYESKYMLAEDLQKIRRSNHSSHHARREVMDDNDEDHDAFIKGLMYPGLETTMDDYEEFFEEDYDEELIAMESSMDLTNSAPGAVPSVASYPNTSNSNERYSQDSRLQADYYCDYYSNNHRTRPRSDYPDMVGEKLRR